MNPSKRIPELDATRGFALLGILIVNIFVFHAPIHFYQEFYSRFNDFQSTFVELTVSLLGGKFLFIFAFLFGYGISIQKDYLKAKFKLYFTKRMMVLLILGLLHVLLLWFGDILFLYALLGLIMIRLYNLSEKAKNVISLFCIFFPSLYYLILTLFDCQIFQINSHVDFKNYFLIYQNGNYNDIFKIRVNEFLVYLPNNIIWNATKTLGLFLVGNYFYQKSIITKVKNRIKKYLVLSCLFILIGILWNFSKADFFEKFDLQSYPLWRPLLIAINIFFETLLGFGYLIILIIAFKKFCKLTQLFANAGRLALTNYIMQSIICVLIFNGFGLKYYGKLLPFELLIIAISVYIFQLFLSSLYLNRYEIGPLELMWRKLSTNY